MIGIVLVSHGNLACEMRAVTEHVVGPLDGVVCVGISTEDDIEDKRRDIFDAVDAVNTGDGVIIVTDMFGGTPSNLAISVMEDRGVDVISGMNIPMLVKLMRTRDCSIAEAVAAAEEAGRRYINIASELLKTGEK